MRSSYGETSGFSAVGTEELMLVNGGKGGGGGGGGSVTIGQITNANIANALNGNNVQTSKTTNPTVSKVVSVAISVAASFIPGIGGIIASTILGDSPLH
jgi:hypothetical protein